MARIPLTKAKQLFEFPQQLIVEDHVVDKGTITKMFEDLGYDANTVMHQEAKSAIQQLLRTSLAPCVHNIARMANVAPKKLYRTTIEKILLMHISDIAETAFGPPYSRNAIYESVIIDWLTKTVPSGGYYP